jgi:hypothetical protein
MVKSAFLRAGSIARLRRAQKGQVRLVPQFVDSLAQRDFDHVLAKEAYGKCDAPREIKQAFAVG